MKKSVLTIALACSSLFLIPEQGRAQSMTVQFGTFTKQASLRDCLEYATLAISGQHLKLYERGAYVRIGGNANVIVQVVCVPTGQANGLAVTVSAFSTDSKTAELTRNTVREKIMGMQRID
jgi:hypothetical protein